MINKPDDDEMTEFTIGESSTSPLLLSPTNDLQHLEHQDLLSSTKGEPLHQSTVLSSMKRARNASFRNKSKHKQLLSSNTQHEERMAAKTKTGTESPKRLLLSPGRSSSCSNHDDEYPAKNLISLISGSLQSPPLFATPKIGNIDFPSRKQQNGRKTTKDSATNPLLQSQANSEKHSLLSTFSNLMPLAPLSPEMRIRNRSFTSYKQFYPKEEEESRITNTMRSSMRIRRSRSLSGRDSETSKKKTLLDEAKMLSDASIRSHRGRSLSLRDSKMSKKKTECYNQLEEEDILVIHSPLDTKKVPVVEDKTLSDDENTSSRRSRQTSRRSRRGRSLSLRDSKTDKKETLSDDDKTRSRSQRTLRRNSQGRSRRGSKKKKKTQCYTQLEEEETLLRQNQKFGDDPAQVWDDTQVEEAAPLFHRTWSCGNLEKELGSTIDEINSTTLTLPITGRKTPEITVEETNTTNNDDDSKTAFQSRRTTIRNIRRRSLSLRDRKTLNTTTLLEEEGEEKTLLNKRQDFCGGPTLEIDETQMEDGALFSRPSSCGNLLQTLNNTVHEVDSPALSLPDKVSSTLGTPLEEKINSINDDDSTLSSPRPTRMQDSRRSSLSRRDSKSSKTKVEPKTNKSNDGNFPRMLRLTRMRSSRIRSLSLRDSKSSKKTPESFNQLEEKETLLCQSQDSCDGPAQELDETLMGSKPLIHCPTKSGNLQQELRTTNDEVTSPAMPRPGKDRDSAKIPVEESNTTNNDHDNTSRRLLRTSIGISLRRSLSLRDSRISKKKTECYNRLKEEETLLCQPQSLRDGTAEDDARMSVGPPSINRTASADIGTDGSRNTTDRSRRTRGRSQRTRGRSTRRSSLSTRDRKMNKKQNLVEEEETLLCKRLNIFDDLGQALDDTQREEEPRSCGNLLHESCTAIDERDSPALPLPGKVIGVHETSPSKNDNDNTPRRSRRNRIRGSLRRSLSLRDSKTSKKKTECYNQLEEEEMLVIHSPACKKKNPVEEEVTLSDDENTRSRARRPSTRNRRGRSLSRPDSKMSKKKTQSYTELEEEETLLCPSQARENTRVMGAASLHNLENELASTIHEVYSPAPSLLDKNIKSPETIAKTTNDDNTPHLSRQIRSFSLGDRKPSQEKSLQVAEEAMTICDGHVQTLENTQMEAGPLLYRSRSCGDLLQELRTSIHEVDSPAHSLPEKDINLPGIVVEETNTTNTDVDNRSFSPSDNRTNKNKAMVKEGGELLFSHEDICDNPVEALDHTQIGTRSLCASVLVREGKKKTFDVAGEENENTNEKQKCQPQRKRRFPLLNFNHQALDDTDISLDGQRPESPLCRGKKDDGHDDSEPEEGVEVLNDDGIIGTTWIQSPGSKPHLELNIETMKNDSGGSDNKKTQQKKAAIQRAQDLWSQRYLRRACSQTDEESYCFPSPSPNSLAAQLA